MTVRLLQHRFLIAAAAAGLAATVLTAPPSMAVANGSLDTGAHPSVGALTVATPQGRVLACTGTLVSPTVLVTAAHCTTEIQLLTGHNTTDVSFDTNLGTG